jgi:AcrR family transcriptional regulator
VSDQLTAVRRRAAALPPEERRAAIVEATLPLLVKHGEMVTTRQIAEAAEIAEGTIFRAFADKDELIAAVVESALDTAPLEAHLETIDRSMPFEGVLLAAVVILQQRVLELWRLLSSIGPRFHDPTRRPVIEIAALVELLDDKRAKLRVEPAVAARHLRALTLAATHPMMVSESMSPEEIVELFLHGVSRTRPRTPSADGGQAPC